MGGPAPVAVAPSPNVHEYVSGLSVGLLEVEPSKLTGWPSLTVRLEKESRAVGCCSEPTSWENSDVLPEESVAVAATNWAPLDGVGKLNEKSGVVSRAIGHEGDRPEDVPPFAVAGGVQRRQGVKIERELRVGRAVEAAEDGGCAKRARYGGQDRVVLEVVGAAMRTARGIAGNTVAAQVDPQGTTRENGIQPDGVAGAG